MNFPNSWTLEDILTANFLPSTKSSKLRLAFEEFESLDEFMHSDKSYKYGFKFSSPELISDTKNKIISKARDTAKLQIDLCYNKGVNIITYWDETYPELLREISYPPLIIYVKGKLQNPDSVSISIVGTRLFTQYGQRVTEKFTEFFVRQNIIITSGLANGIDTISHLTAIKSGGITYAVVACGIDRITPSLHLKNSEKIVESGGAIISEYPCGTTAKPGYFPIRNRIISGISKATIVMECAEKSGALITAKFAFDEEREVFAIPGNVDSDKSKGTNRLIKNNIASIALSPEQVSLDLGLLIDEGQIDFKNKQEKFLSNEEAKIMKILVGEPIHIDEIASISEIEIPELLVLLLNLEFNGMVKQLPGKYYIKY